VSDYSWLYVKEVQILNLDLYDHHVSLKKSSSF
jgi:hypothetical protein